jgi:hypothetical protein
MHGCRLQGWYSGAPMPFLLYSLCHVYAVKIRVQTVYTNVSVSVHNDCHKTGLLSLM